jgi:hypothetical protein
MTSCKRDAFMLPDEAPAADVIDFGAARERQLLGRYRERAQAVLGQNQEALQRLYESGIIFTRHGTRVGRELLQAHRHLLQVVDMVKKAPTSMEDGMMGRLIEGAALFDEIEALLGKTNAITERNKSVFQSNPGF